MASREQSVLMRQFHDHSGFEFMGKNDVRANDPVGFIQKWDHNIEWLRRVADETDYMLRIYRNKNDA